VKLFGWIKRLFVGAPAPKSVPPAVRSVPPVAPKPLAMQPPQPPVNVVAWDRWDDPYERTLATEATQENLDAQYPLNLPPLEIPDVHLPTPTVMPSVKLPEGLSDALSGALIKEDGWTALNGRTWKKQVVMALTLADGRTTSVLVTAIHDGEEEAFLTYLPINPLERASS
jgi:hypothetical protein